MTDQELIENYRLTSKPGIFPVAASILRALQAFLAAREMSILQANESDILDFRQHSLATRKSELSVDYVMSHVRRFYQWCLSQGYLDVNPAAAIKGKNHAKRTPPTAAEMEHLIGEAEAAVNRTRGTRGMHRSARRILLVIYLSSEAGIRPQELSKLTLSDFDPETHSVVVARNSVHERTAPLSRAAWNHLIGYLRATGKRRVGGPGYLFHPRNQTDQPLKAIFITKGLDKLVLKAGLRPELTAVNLARNVLREVGEAADLDVALAVTGRIQLRTAAVLPVSVSVADLRAAVEHYHPLGRRSLADLRRSSAPK